MVKVDTGSGKVVIPSAGKRSFASNITLRKSSIHKCLDFAHEMSYGEGHHNASSFGGSDLRSQAQIFRDSLQGKIAELSFYNFMYKLEYSPDSKPNFEIWGKGKWEDLDFQFNEGAINISLKSTKHIGNLLLLEKHRYSEEGAYLEPANGGDPVIYDYTFLVRVKGIKGESKDDFTDVSSIDCEVAGYMDNELFRTIIGENQMISRGTTIGIPMKVDNYYVCLSDLSDPETFTEAMQE